MPAAPTGKRCVGPAVSRAAVSSTMGEQWQTIRVGTGEGRSAGSRRARTSSSSACCSHGTAGCAAGSASAAASCSSGRCCSPRSSRSLLATVAFTGQQILLSQCSLKDLRPLALGENSFLYTDNGQLLGVVPSATNRQPLPLYKIAPSLPQATVAIEDARFWQHGALDYRGIVRALYQDIAHGPGRAGRLDHHPGARPEPLHRQPAADAVAQDQGGLPRREVVRQAHPQADPHRLPQRGLLREARVRCPGGLADVLLQARLEADARAGRTARRAAAGADGVRPAQQPARRARPAQRGAARDVEERLHHRVASCGSATRKGLELRPGHLYTQQHQPNFFGWATQQLANRKFGQQQVELGGLKVTTTLDHAPAGARDPRGHSTSCTRRPTRPRRSWRSIRRRAP